MAWEKLHTGNWKDVAEVNPAPAVATITPMEEATSKTSRDHSLNTAYHAVLPSRPNNGA